MGFTRYWVRPAELEAERFSAFSRACQEACQEYSDSIFSPRFTGDEVAFDGFPPCEPFMIERVSSNAWRENRRRENGIFEYCKTQGLPYDATIARCLELLKEHFPEVEVSDPSKDLSIYRIETGVIAYSVFFIIVFFLTTTAFAQHGLPSSPRSLEVIARVKPVLERALIKKGLNLGGSVFLRIFKEEKKLEVWMRKGAEYVLFKPYPICTYGSGGLGPKTREGDGIAPEGFYVVFPDCLNPKSNFHLSIYLGYPNDYDKYHNRTGSAIMIHGGCVSIGCFAMTDSYIEEIYTLVDAAFKKGQPFINVHIFPFEMHAENMGKNKDSQWHDFWTNLKEGYDEFNNGKGNLSKIEVEDGRYVFQNENDL